MHALKGQQHIAQGKRSDTLGFPHSRVSAPCKGKSFISISNIECFCPFRASILWQSVTQGVASLVLGYVLLSLQGVHYLPVSPQKGHSLLPKIGEAMPFIFVSCKRILQIILQCLRLSNLSYPNHLFR